MNINESVTIKLNETGMEILRDEHADLKSAFPSLHDFVEIEADEDGLYPKKMQLWSVMRTFGPYISLGTNPPFSTEIEISDFDDVNKLKEINKELLAALKRVVGDVRTLADHSYGVHGLHQNGDLAPWNSLFSGGFFESWLLSVDDADAVIAKTEGGAA